VFLTFTRKLPKKQVAVAVNVDMILWAQEYEEGWTTLFMDSGPDLTVEGSLDAVRGRLNLT
jgi:hypothetical protein